MKGRTTCPKCNEAFVVDAPDNIKKLNVTCPKCNNKFLITLKSSDLGECSWEEHGEPRKTILSSIKPKTDKPKMVSFLLTIAFIFGLVTAAFSVQLIDNSSQLLSQAGFRETIEFYITDINNESLSNANLKLNGITDFQYNGEYYYLENITPGFKTVVISLEGYKTINQEILVIPLFFSTHNIKMEMGTGEITYNFGILGCSLMFLILSIFPLLGAITSYKRRHFDVAVVGSLIGIFSVGFYIGSIICIIALIILLLSRDEFENGEKGKTF